MASWMVHLRIAELLLGQIDGLDPEAFAVGNIAPDSGLPTDGRRVKFEPPKSVTHYRDGVLRVNRDLDFVDDYLRDCDRTDRARWSFCLGYWCHILTDNLWIYEVWRPTIALHAERYEDDRKNLIQEVKAEWYGLDFVYLAQTPNSFFERVFLGCDYPTHYVDCTSQKGVQTAIQMIKGFYQEDRQVDEAWVYLSAETLTTFINQAATQLLHCYERCCVQKKVFDGHLSILDVPDQYFNEPHFGQFRLKYRS